MITLSNVGWKSGLREWILQRFTGVFITVYFLFIVGFFFKNGGFNYLNLLILFSSFLFKLFTILFVFNLVLHVSIGFSIIITDYIEITFLRVFFDFMINIMLLSYVFCIMQIIWGVR